MTDHCPVCGTPGRVVSSDEGTHHFLATLDAERDIANTGSLAALLHVEIRDKGWASCVHSPEGEWLPFCAEIAARLIAAGVALDAARQPAPEAALRHAHPSVHPSQCEACAALAATPNETPDPAAPDLRSSAAWLVQRWDGNRTVEPDALRADIAVLRSALRGATPGLGGKPRG